MRFAKLAVAFAIFSLAVGSASSLTIIPTFASNINSDPNAAIIKATINAAIAAYEADFTDPITVNITFQEGGGLGSNDSFFGDVPYATYLAALTADQKTGDDATALLHLPSALAYQAFFGTTDISIKTANARAVGILLNPPPGSPDGTITLNTSLMNLSRSGPQDPSKYDLLAVAEHEINELLGLGSALPTPPSGNPFPEDLFRYNSLGRSYSAANGTAAFFSIDGATLLVPFHNTNDGADYGDWENSSTVRVQDAFGTPGAQPDLGVELRALDVIGFDLAVPEPATGVLVASALAVLGILTRRRRAA